MTRPIHGQDQLEQAEHQRGAGKFVAHRQFGHELQEHVRPVLADEVARISHEIVVDLVGWVLRNKPCELARELRGISHRQNTYSVARMKLRTVLEIRKASRLEIQLQPIDNVEILRGQHRFHCFVHAQLELQILRR